MSELKLRRKPRRALSLKHETQMVPAFGETCESLTMVLRKTGRVWVATFDLGNCMFESICLSLVERGIATDTPSQVREKVAKEIADHQDEYIDFFTSSVDNQLGDDHVDLEDYQDATFQDYVARIAKDKQWGGNIELQAAAEVYRTEIKVSAREESRRGCPLTTLLGLVSLGPLYKKRAQAPVAVSGVPPALQSHWRRHRR
jgi:hypothetical protein